MFLQGDKVEIVILNASGIHREFMDLRKDWCFYRGVYVHSIDLYWEC